MQRPLKSVSIYIGIFLLVLSPVLISGIPRQNTIAPEPRFSATLSEPVLPLSNSRALIEQSDALYDSMKLKRTGLSKKAFEFAWKGYQYMLSKKC